MGLTRVQSKGVGAANIRINSVMPVAIVTERQKVEVLTAEYRAEIFQYQSLQCDLVSEGVAKVIVFVFFFECIEHLTNVEYELVRISQLPLLPSNALSYQGIVTSKRNKVLWFDQAPLRRHLAPAKMS